MATMERTREDFETSLAMANYLVIPSKGFGLQEPETRVFECKTCNRKFPSFQALGGHRASHKKPRLGPEASHDDQVVQVGQSQNSKAKTHECSICGLEFTIGQALGGHMRCHRAGSLQIPRLTPSLSLKVGSAGLGRQDLKKGDNGKDQSEVDHRDHHGKRRVKWLDLKLTPLELLLDTGMLSPVC